MAFRRRAFSSFRRRRFRRGGASTNKKWIGYHTSSAATLQPTVGNTMSTGPVFDFLVSPSDYADELSDNLAGVERQERTKVIRSIGSISPTMIFLPPETQLVGAWEFWYYFAVLNLDDVANGILLNVASPGTGALDTFDLGLETSPPLYRHPVKKFHSVGKLFGSSLIAGRNGFYQMDNSRSWDFNPSAFMQTPGAWTLVWGITAFILDPLPPPVAVTCNAFVMARTLIAD